MKIVRHTDRDFAARIAELKNASSLFDPTVEQKAREIVEAVARRGDEALLEFSRKLDCPTLTAEQIKVTQAELMTAALKADSRLRGTIAEAARNISRFAARSKKKNWSMRNSHGGRVGEKFDPYSRVGIYIPGGKAPLISTSLMTICLAKTAGCPEIVVCTPPDAQGQINEALLYAARSAGATSIFRAGGAQAIAAMAYGTRTIPRVEKIFGPGNAYVVAAKRLVIGRVSIDLLPGPSEVLVLADDTADAAYVVADLLAQAEHGSGHERVWLVTTSRSMLKKVQEHIGRLLPKLARKELIEKVLANNAWFVQAADLDQAIDLVNQIAPEHCELLNHNPRALVPKIVTAGAIFVGPYSPTVLGDYVAGPSHTLPTGGAGRSFAGLTVDDFQRRTSVVEYNAAALKKALPAIEHFGALEGLGAHAASARLRAARKAKRK